MTPFAGGYLFSLPKGYEKYTYYSHGSQCDIIISMIVQWFMDFDTFQ